MASRLIVLLAFAVSGLGFVAPPSAVADGECPDGLRCLAVTVPLDWSGKQNGNLDLSVEVGEGTGPVLLFLAGGPGQGFAEYGETIQTLFDRLGANYRIAVLDQRGTGATAINCKPLQALNLTDLTVRPPPVVRACGKQLGKRRAFYSTRSTVLDLDAVRKAIGIKRWTMMGTSYGTYVVERYARKFPNRVSRIILDSVVPQENVDPFMRETMRRAGTVLGWVCGGGKCGFRSDPVSDLRKVVAKGKGPQILDWMTTIFSFDQAGIPMVGRAIHQASRGKYGGLAEVRKKAREMAGISPVKSLSWGLHAATLCSDLSLPYSIGWTSRRNRVKATNRFLARAPGRDFGPFDRATARNNGVSQVCLDWPAIKVASPPKPGRLSQPTLILAGQYDLSTPVSYAKRELSRAPRGHLIVVPKAGHSVALRGSCADPGLASFLKGQPVGNPCQAGNHELQPRTISPWRIP